MVVETSYHDRTPDDWDWEQAGRPLHARVREYRHTVGDWFRLLRDAGLQVLDIVEPEPVQGGCGRGWGRHYSARRQRMVPATIIWKAGKPALRRR